MSFGWHLTRDALAVGLQSIHQMKPGDRAPDPGWLKAIDFGCAQQVINSKPLSRRTGTPVYMVRPSVY